MDGEDHPPLSSRVPLPAQEPGWLFGIFKKNANGPASREVREALTRSCEKKDERYFNDSAAILTSVALTVFLPA